MGGGRRGCVVQHFWKYEWSLNCGLRTLGVTCSPGLSALWQMLAGPASVSRIRLHFAFRKGKLAFCTIQEALTDEQELKD